MAPPHSKSQFDGRHKSQPIVIIDDDDDDDLGPIPTLSAVLGEPRTNVNPLSHPCASTSFQRLQKERESDRTKPGKRAQPIDLTGDAKPATLATAWNGQLLDLTGDVSDDEDMGRRNEGPGDSPLQRAARRSHRESLEEASLRKSASASATLGKAGAGGDGDERSATLVLSPKRTATPKKSTGTPRRSKNSAASSTPSRRSQRMTTNGSETAQDDMVTLYPLSAILTPEMRHAPAVVQLFKAVPNMSELQILNLRAALVFDLSASEDMAKLERVIQKPMRLNYDKALSHSGNTEQDTLYQRFGLDNSSGAPKNKKKKQTQTQAPKASPSSAPASSPGKRKRRSTIEDSEKAPEVPELPKVRQIQQFEPAPEYVPEPVPAKPRKKFTDWTRPTIPLDYPQILALWEKYTEEFKDDHARFAADKLERARRQNEKAQRRWREMHRELDEKAKATGNDITWWNAPAKNEAAIGKPGANQFTITSKAAQKGAPVRKSYVDMAGFECKAVDIPHFRAYYPVKKSQLVQSDKDLLFWPEATETNSSLKDDGLEPEARVKKELYGHFNFRMDWRIAETAYVQMGRQWQPYAQAFLEELNLSEEDMLRYLLDDTYDVVAWEELTKVTCPKQQVTPKALLKLTRRQLAEAPQAESLRIRIAALNELEADHEDLKKLKFKYLALAFYTVSSSYRYVPDVSCFSFIYCLAESPDLDIAQYLKDLEGHEDKKLEYSAATHFDLACRICHTFPCFSHGIDSVWDHKPVEGSRESDDDEDLSASGELHPLSDTLTKMHRQRLGRKLVQAPQPHDERPKHDVEFDEDNDNVYGDPHGQSKATVFFPCNHRGPCEIGVCHCAGSLTGHCEKSCGCGGSCKLRFKGCKCARKGKVCSEESKCPCLKADRECDPDICGACGVYDALDPQNRDKDEEWFHDKCSNCQIQRNIPKRTLIGESTTHGLGLFAGEDIKRGEYIGEYVGAKLSWNQAERSGLYLLLNDYSYLFDMTGDQTVDSMVLGNKTRYINSIWNNWNCAPKVLMCNTAHRMGLYATKDIQAGDELSYYYGESFFENHKKKVTGEPDLDALVGVKKYKRAPYGKRGQYKKGKGKRILEPAVPAIERVKATTTMRKSVLREARSGAEQDDSIRRMVDALQVDDAEAGAEEMDIDAEMEDMDSESDEMDDGDFASEIEESDAEDESDDDRSGIRYPRAMRTTAGRGKQLR